MGIGHKGCISIALVALLLTACSDTSLPEPVKPPELEVSASHYQASISYTDYGIPHITAADFGSLGYGEGYAAAGDHICLISHSILKARGELAAHFGAGANNENLISDVAMRALDIPLKGKQALAAQSNEIQQWLTGYAAGVNRYLDETQVDNIEAWCKGQPWVQPISAEDLAVRMVSITQTLPHMGAAIAAAQPPAESEQQVSLPVSYQQLAAAEAGLSMEGFGSNAWAIGEQRTETGRGMLLGNPHYPWTGSRRFWEKHLTIPGKLNVYGASLVGLPGVALGFNNHVAWSHTVSDSQRVAIYRLRLVENDPHSYHYDNEIRKLTPREVRVSVLGDKGVAAEQSHTVWFSHHGPLMAMPGHGWNAEYVLAARDANRDNVNMLDQWLDMGRAKDMTVFKEAHRRWNAMPWVNTIAVSDDGRAVYLDNSNVGNLSADAIDSWRSALDSDAMVSSFYEQRDLVILDGSDSRAEFQTEPGSVIPGVVPYDRKPNLERPSYAFNSNDSYWLSNPEEPLTGFSPLYGKVETPRSPRTRMNALLLTKNSPFAAAGEDGLFSRQEIQQALFANVSLSAQLLQRELLSVCQSQPQTEYDGEQVDLNLACRALAGFNGRLDLTSSGAVLFREWLAGYPFTDFLNSGDLFATPFDPADPLNTPRDLGDKDRARQQLARAVSILKKAGLDEGAKLGEVQAAYFDGKRVPVHGGVSHEGVANLMIPIPRDPLAFPLNAVPVEGSPFLTDKGYPIGHGTSFVFTVSYTENGPEAEALLTYGQAGTPASPHYTDQVTLFARKQWRPVLWRAEDIDANTRRSLALIGERAPPGKTAAPGY